MAEAWSERMQEAGIDPAEVKTLADDIESGRITPEQATNQTRDIVSEQLAEQYVAEQFMMTTAAQIAAKAQEPQMHPDWGDEKLVRAAYLVVNSQFGSTSMLQRQMRLSYREAEQLMDRLERCGIVGPGTEATPARSSWAIPQNSIDSSTRRPQMACTSGTPRRGKNGQLSPPPPSRILTKASR
ncbi:DNA translocase FtsK [Nocardia africana]|uniref:DNA translocase FtsK n=1 Tax=Nocardia africana TaxID=134964 RepID=UPI001C68B7EF|nr:DNA translocase FtsK [Nocardia africana]